MLVCNLCYIYNSCILCRIWHVDAHQGIPETAITETRSGEDLQKSLSCFSKWRKFRARDDTEEMPQFRESLHTQRKGDGPG